MEPLLDPEERDLEQSLLSAGRDIHMSKRLQTQTLAALGLGAVSLTAAATAQAGSVVWFKTKIGVLLLSVGGTMGALGAGYFVSESSNTERDGATPATVALSGPQSQADHAAGHANESAKALSAEQLAAEKSALDAESRRIAPENSTQKAAQQAMTPTAAKSPTTLTDELDHITRATSALNRGQPQIALKILSDYQTRFPRPQLGLEVEVLRIEALAKSGNQVEAHNRANRFIARYPNSALVARVKRVLR